MLDSHINTASEAELQEIAAKARPLYEAGDTAAGQTLQKADRALGGLLRAAGRLREARICEEELLAVTERLQTPGDRSALAGEITAIAEEYYHLVCDTPVERASEYVTILLDCYDRLRGMEEVGQTMDGLFYERIMPLADRCRTAGTANYGEGDVQIALSHLSETVRLYEWMSRLAGREELVADAAKYSGILGDWKRIPDNIRCLHYEKAAGLYERASNIPGPQSNGNLLGAITCCGNAAVLFERVGRLASAKNALMDGLRLARRMCRTDPKGPAQTFLMDFQMRLLGLSIQQSDTPSEEKRQ